MMRTKQCSKCKRKRLATTEFFYRRKSSKDGWDFRCKDCVKKWAKSRGGRKWRNEYMKSSARRKAQRRGNLLAHYGMTEDDYNTLFIEQEGCCAICGLHQSEYEKRLSVDHNHQTNKVRGLLCHHCNCLLGNAGENSITLEKAIEYLKMWNTD